MKTKLLLLTLMALYGFQANAYNSLYLRDPQGWWSSGGKIDTALISIKPKGAFMECGLYLTLNWGNYTHYDTTEITLNFDLPDGAFITDSWLWVGDQIIQAELLDRDRAHTIYEGIVQRRQDPSILYKNSQTAYELRVFPLPPNQKRKVKITYMVPAQWSGNKVSVPLPVNILRTSETTPVLQVLAYTDAEWQNPTVTNIPQNVNFQAVSGQDFNVANIPSAYIPNFDIAIAYTKPTQSAVYAKIEPTGANEGYYQLVVNTTELFNISTNRKMVLAIDHDTDKANTTKTAILNQARQLLHKYYNNTDSFNVFLSNFSTYQHATVWLPCDSQTIENVFNAITPANLSHYSSLPALLSSAINFIKSTGSNASITLLSSSCSYNSVAAGNQLVNDILGLMAPTMYRVNVLDYADKNVPYYWNNNSYYGNEYFYNNLTTYTGGNYVVMRTNYYPYYNYTLAEASNILFDMSQPKIQFPEIMPSIQNGFCHSKFNSFAAGQSIPINTNLMQFGKYVGNLPMNVQVTGMYQGQPLLQQVSIQSATGDTMTRKIWNSYYMDALQFSATTISNSVRIEVMDSSKANRVLSRYTAFLALEPSDTTQACSDCEDETNWGGVAVNTEGLDSVTVSAYPNPFGQSLNIQVRSLTAGEFLNIQILDITGRQVFQHSMEYMDTYANYVWDGSDTNGNRITSGVYLVKVYTDQFSKVLRVVKQ